MESSQVSSRLEAVVAEVPQPRERPSRGVSPADRRGYVLRRLFALSDLLALAAAAGAMVGVMTLAGRGVPAEHAALVAIFLPLWVPIGLAARLYHVGGRGATGSTVDELGPVFWAATAWSWLLLVTSGVVAVEAVSLLSSAVLWALSVPFVLGGRGLMRTLTRGRDWHRVQAIVVGRVADASRVGELIARHPELGITVRARLDPRELDRALSAMHGGTLFSRNGDRDEGAGQAPVPAPPGIDGRIARVIFATPPDRLAERTEVVRRLTEAGLQVDLVAGDPELLSTGAELHDLEGVPVVSMSAARPRQSALVAKRCFDLALAVPALVLLAPLLAFLAVRIKLESAGPVLYRQQRVGRSGRPFQFLKLRSMVADADRRLDEVAALQLHGEGVDGGIFKACKDPRVTRVGRWLRRWSLDELPQLWNVIRGDMSLVGPRPLPLREDERIRDHWRVRCLLRPGITGSWQVSGRSEIPLDDMVRLDYAYVMNLSLAGDVKLLLRTIGAVARGHGAY